MVTKTILVTIIEDENGNKEVLYGRFDAVAVVRRGFKIIRQDFFKCSMPESTFFNESTRKELQTCH